MQKQYYAVVDKPRLELVQGQRNGIVQVFLDSDFRNAHEGLAAIALQAGIDVSKLEPGQYVVFVNHAKDRIKLYAADNIIAYQKLPKGQIADLRTLAKIPLVFRGGGLHYDEALKHVLQERLAG